MIDGAAWRDFWLAMASHLWLATAVILALATIDRFVLRRAPARWSMFLWTACLAVLCVPASLVAARLEPLLASVAPAGSGGDVALPAAALRTVLQPELLLIPTGPDVNAWLWLTATVGWLLGGLALGATLIRRGRAAPSAVATVEPVMGKRLAAAVARAGVAPDRVVITAESCVPHVRGVFRPRIVVAEQLLDALETRELAAVLTHENAHLRRRDPARRAGYGPVLLVFWFFPLTWLVFRRLHRATEMACDEAVLRAGFEPEVYARAIARTLRSSSRWGDARVVALGRPRGADIRDRLEAIQRAGKETSMKRIIVAQALAGVVFAAAVAAAAPSPGASIPIQERGTVTAASPPDADARSQNEQEAPQGGWVYRQLRDRGQLEQLLGLRGVGRELDVDMRASVRDILLFLGRMGGFSVRFEDFDLPPGQRFEMDLKMEGTTVGLALANLARGAGLSYRLASRDELIVSVQSPYSVDAVYPRWSPDGRRIRFSNSDGSVYIVPLEADAEGGAVRRRDDRSTARDRPLRVGGDIQAPERTAYVAPEYPTEARRAGLQGVVILEATISKQGRVIDTRVLRGLGLGLDEAAVEAVRQWQYTPTLYDGRPVRVVLTVTVGFALEE